MIEAAILMADGFEEIEAVTVIDVLRRADIDIKIISTLKKLLVTGGHGIVIEADAFLEEINFEEVSMLIIPGGGAGVKNLTANARVIEILKSRKKKPIAAICAAPSLLASVGLLKGIVSTSFPGFRDSVEKGGGKYIEDRVVISDQIITSRSPGTAMEFALALVKYIKNEEKALSLAKQMLVN